MNRVGKVVAAVSVLLASGCSSVRGHAEVVGPPQVGFSFSVSIDAATGLGGTASRFAPGDWVEGPVTCVAVAGNRATVGVRNIYFDWGDPDAGGLFFVEDNGSPGDGVDIVNVVGTEYVPTTCEPPTDQQLDFFVSSPGLEPIYSGDIVVGVLGINAQATQSS